MNKSYFEYNSGEIIARLGNGEKLLLSGLDFHIEKGDSMALIGKTGSGKTMTALSIMGLLPSNVYQKDAAIILDGKDLFGLSEKDYQKIRGDEIVYIPQNGAEFLCPSLTIKSQMYDSLKKLGVKKIDLHRTACEKLRIAGFGDPEAILEDYSFRLSGGMNQRVCIALAACGNAKLLIADEPTNGLDTAAKENFIKILDHVFPQACKLIITHDPSLAAMCDKVFEIRK